MHFIDTPDPVWQLQQADDGPLPAPGPRPHSLLTLPQWQAVRATWPSGLPLGVLVPNDTGLALLADDLPRFALVALQFPKWTDGRAYSQARLLRSRHRFTGELRATGDVVVDMVPLLQRTGFDSVQLRPGQDIAAAQRSLRFFAAHYQGDALVPLSHFLRPGAAS